MVFAHNFISKFAFLLLLCLFFFSLVSPIIFFDTRLFILRFADLDLLIGKHITYFCVSVPRYDGFFFFA